MYLFTKTTGLGLLLLFAITACNQKQSWSVEKNFEQNQWQYADSLVFSYENQQIGTHPLQLNVSVNDDYAYRNLWVKLQITAPDGKTQTALSEFLLMDETGNWHVEKSWFSEYHNFETQWGNGINFPQKGVYKIKIIQYMREDVLKGIHSIGLGI